MLYGPRPSRRRFPCSHVLTPSQKNVRPEHTAGDPGRTTYCRSKVRRRRSFAKGLPEWTLSNERGKRSSSAPVGAYRRRFPSRDGRVSNAQKKKPRDRNLEASESGVGDGTRTHDNRNHNPGLYQLSYTHRLLLVPAPKRFRILQEFGGLSRVAGKYFRAVLRGFSATSPRPPASIFKTPPRRCFPRIRGKSRKGGKRTSPGNRANRHDEARRGRGRKICVLRSALPSKERTRSNANERRVYKVALLQSGQAVLIRAKGADKRTAEH